MKVLILDSGPLISLALSGLLPILENIKRKFPEIKMVITPSVKKEAIDRAFMIKKYELEAVKLTDLIDKKVIELATDFVKRELIEKETSRILRVANETIKAGNKFINIVQEGEASCLAFSNLCGCDNIIAIDERTTRLLTESPENLVTIMQRKLHMSVMLNKQALKEFKDFEYIRSSELVYIAFVNNLTELKKDKQVLDALLYSVKFAGTAVSSKEIEEIKSLI